jgi:predicted ATPase
MDWLVQAQEQYTACMSQGLDEDVHLLEQGEPAAVAAGQTAFPSISAQGYI